MNQLFGAAKHARIRAMSLEEEAIALLLRSPRLPVATIIDLLDVSDAAFRAMARRNQRIAALLVKRRDGTLAQRHAEPIVCPQCEDWFVPYAAARFCSDSCRSMARLHQTSTRRTLNR
jgi:hypothetical protein